MHQAENITIVIPHTWHAHTHSKILYIHSSSKARFAKLETQTQSIGKHKTKRKNKFFFSFHLQRKKKWRQLLENQEPTLYLDPFHLHLDSAIHTIHLLTILLLPPLLLLQPQASLLVLLPFSEPLLLRHVSVYTVHHRRLRRFGFH